MFNKIALFLIPILGLFLVLRKFSLIGDGIAHISFGGVATGLLFNITPFIGALLFGLWLGDNPAVNELKNSLPLSLFSSESPLIGDGLVFLRRAIGEVSANVPSLTKSSSEPASS